MAGLSEGVVDGNAAETVPPSSKPVGGRAKRILDVSTALAALLAMWPIFVLIMVVIKISDPGPVFFAHERVGFRGRRFPCLKFRSMVRNSDEVLRQILTRDPNARTEWEATQKLRRDPRTTAIGRLLRTTSLDELPQLINVLLGDMSIVGPRPVVEEELGRYGSFERAYVSARPGLTGAWQVSGRSEIGYDRRIELDVDYVKNWTLMRDVGIIVKTAFVVMARKGSC